jgi:hypothetical protein
MTRRLLNLVTVLSLLLCVAVCALWVRSYWRNDVAAYEPSPREFWSASSRPSVVHLGHMHIKGREADDVAGSNPGWQFLGFAWASGSHGGRYGVRHLQVLVVPYWSLALATALMPVGRLYARFRSRRGLGPGHCRNCGYDLRATPDRCPECGTIRVTA